MLNRRLERDVLGDGWEDWIWRLWEDGKMGKRLEREAAFISVRKSLRRFSRSVIISMPLLRMQTCLVKSGQNVRRGCLNESQRRSESPTVGGWTTCSFINYPDQISGCFKQWRLQLRRTCDTIKVSTISGFKKVRMIPSMFSFRKTPYTPWLVAGPVLSPWSSS